MRVIEQGFSISRQVKDTTGLLGSVVYMAYTIYGPEILSGALGQLHNSQCSHGCVEYRPFDMGGCAFIERNFKSTPAILTRCMCTAYSHRADTCR